MEGFLTTSPAVVPLRVVDLQGPRVYDVACIFCREER